MVLAHRRPRHPRSLPLSRLQIRCTCVVAEKGRRCADRGNEAQPCGAARQQGWVPTLRALRADRLAKRRRIHVHPTRPAAAAAATAGLAHSTNISLRPQQSWAASADLLLAHEAIRAHALAVMKLLQDVPQHVGRERSLQLHWRHGIPRRHRLNSFCVVARELLGELDRLGRGLADLTSAEPIAQLRNELKEGLSNARD
eukprot:COSAG02_NODE_101_length_36804_cov_125.342951_22_plen_199_part_00